MAGQNEFIENAPPPYPFAVILVVLLYYYDIPISDRVFAVAYSLYVLAADFLRFDRNRLAKQADKPNRGLQFEPDEERGQHQGFFDIYIGCYAVVGVLGPLSLLACTAYLRYTQQDDNSAAAEMAATAAAPHLFLLLSQIIMEHVVGYLDCHGYIQCLVPIGFSVYRQASLLRWTTAAHKQFLKYRNAKVVQLGLILAVLNTIMWTYNTFVFLLLRMMPNYLDQKKYPVPCVEWKRELFPLVKRDKND